MVDDMLEKLDRTFDGLMSAADNGNVDALRRARIRYNTAKAIAGSPESCAFYDTAIRKIGYDKTGGIF